MTFPADYLEDPHVTEALPRPDPEMAIHHRAAGPSSSTNSSSVMNPGPSIKPSRPPTSGILRISYFLFGLFSGAVAGPFAYLVMPCNSRLQEYTAARLLFVWGVFCGLSCTVGIGIALWYTVIEPRI